MGISFTGLSVFMNAESMMLNHKLCIYVDPATLNLRINNKKNVLIFCYSSHMAIHWKMIIVLMYENPLSQADLINRLRKLILSCNFLIVSDGVRIRFWFEVSAWKYINIRFVNHLHLLIQWIFSLLVLLQILVHRMTRPISMVCICF